MEKQIDIVPIYVMREICGKYVYTGDFWDINNGHHCKHECGSGYCDVAHCPVGRLASKQECEERNLSAGGGLLIITDSEVLENMNGGRKNG